MLTDNKYFGNAAKNLGVIETSNDSFINENSITQLGKIETSSLIIVKIKEKVNCTKIFSFEHISIGCSS